MKKLIEFKNISKEFDGQFVLKGINLDIYENEFVTLLGPSGCGKTTLLRMLGGFLSQNEGEIIFDGEEISKLPPYKREVNTVFQKYALFPHMNVYDNIAFGLKTKKEPKDIIEQKVMRMLRLVGLESYKKRSVLGLSGGQQQRIAIARALVNEPMVLLLDEPLGALDLKLRKEMQQELKKIQKEVGITFIFVTHDQEEALTMSDKIVVMNHGNIIQIGSPTDIYNEPINQYVANFIGESNIIDGVMAEDYSVVFEDKKFECVDFGFEKNEAVDVVIRPEDLDIVSPKDGKLRGFVKSVLFKGVHYETIVETRLGTSITVKLLVVDDKPVVNEEACESLSAYDFYLDVDDVNDLTDSKIIELADARAWETDSDEWISIKDVSYDIQAQNGEYTVVFKTQSDTTISVKALVRDQNRVIDKEYQEEIFAMNFTRSIDSISESVALDTDIKTWANASAWDLEDGNSVEITDVLYEFDSENLQAGEYDITFRTQGYDYKVDTTDCYKEGDHVGLTFSPEDIHIMKKGG